jgi:hypothetical protein
MFMFRIIFIGMDVGRCATPLFLARAIWPLQSPSSAKLHIHEKQRRYNHDPNLTYSRTCGPVIITKLIFQILNHVACSGLGL